MTDPRPLRLVDRTDAERIEFINRHYNKQRQQLNGCGCLAALVLSSALWVLASMAAYQLFMWLRY